MKKRLISAALLVLAVCAAGCSEQHAPALPALQANRAETSVSGISSGAYMAGLRGIVLMQTSGFTTLANVLASLTVPCQIPIVMMISERGTIGDHQLGQAIVCRTMRPILETLGIEHFAIQRLDDVEFVTDRMVKQAFTTQAGAALIMSPLLTSRGKKSY